MTVPIHSFRDLRHSTLSLILLVAFAGIAGCADDNSSGGMSSPPDWVVVPSGGRHAKSATLTYIASGGSSSCIECHGADLSGGNSKVSCFGNPSGCHHGPVDGWVVTPPAAQNHGVAAKKAPGNSGFASCQICHGSSFSGGGSKESCFRCHVANAPHPAQPWLGPTYTHADTNTSNAPVCAQCHFPESPNNPANHPATPAAAGMPPGCFNSTLCHGATAAPHAVGAAWRDPNPQFHGLTAKQDLSYCQGCHGTPGTTLFNGGTAPTSCQASTCHTRAKAHPIPWYQASQPFPAYVVSHRDSGNRSVACAICHKADGPGAGPDPNAPSCFTVSSGGILCHSGGPGGVNHSVPFPGATHTSADQTSFTAGCSACHAVTGVSPSSVAPPCAVCHRSATALPFTNCSSCHARPPTGTEYPNVAGSHARHDALENVTGVCASCHNGLGTGTAGHYDRANARPGKDSLRVPPGEAAFLTVYSAKAGPAAFDNATLACANVSCHGGVAAPNWRTGSIDGNTDAGCRQCHKIGTDAGNPENNSPFSGLHAAHLSTTVGGAILCTECHNMANGKAGALNHYKFLNTPQMEGPAGDTVAPNGSAANYVAANQTCGTFNCHTIVHVNFSWSGGREPLCSFHGGEPHLRDVIQFRGQLRFLPFRIGVGDEDRADLHGVPPNRLAADIAQLHLMPWGSAVRRDVSERGRQTRRPRCAARGGGVQPLSHRPGYRHPGALQPCQRPLRKKRVEGAPGRYLPPGGVQREVRDGGLHRREPDLLERDLPRRAGDARLADGDGQRDRRPQRVP